MLPFLIVGCHPIHRGLECLSGKVWITIRLFLILEWVALCHIILAINNIIVVVINAFLCNYTCLYHYHKKGHYLVVVLAIQGPERAEQGIDIASAFFLFFIFTQSGFPWTQTCAISLGSPSILLLHQAMAPILYHYLDENSKTSHKS